MRDCLRKFLYGSITIQSWNSRLERHTKTHKHGSTTPSFQRQLSIALRQKSAQAAALVVLLGISPNSFCDDQAGM